MSDHVDPIEWSRRLWEAGKGPEPDYFAAMAAVLRLEQLVGLALDRLVREHGLSRTGYLILVTLYLREDRTLSMGQLSKRLLLHPTTVSLVTDKLQARELVVRSPHPTDRRTILAELTDEGARTLATVSEALGEVNYGLEGVSDRMAITLTEVIRQVRESMGDA
ncbi:MarR family transcriptional regulator [Pseudonocardia eucalypti]|uniref:MarR family transcriptional regulator n=1 Tax=Pseudonocardia eucalypti TaxID=648755 RepID=A0ABP9RBA6_9PSEU|nr:DNA-binding MarR family transcriptional regulator [Pseudonocardia eucalypti]